MLNFIFWVKKQVTKTGHTMNIYYALYFNRKNYFLQLAILGIYVVVYILAKKTNIGYRYMFGFIFWLCKNITKIG